MRSMTRWTLAGLLLAALGPVAVFGFASAPADAVPSGSLVSTVSDPAGDTATTPNLHSPAFQDIVRGQMTKTASGDFELLMEMAGPVPAAPSLPPQWKEIWWTWFFDLDLTTSPGGYPSPPGFASPVGPEFAVQVRWDGTEFVGVAVDRRPLLTGGEAIITPVSFSIDGTVVEAVLPSTMIGDVPPTFRWGVLTLDWCAPAGTNGHFQVDFAEAVFNP